MNSFLRATTLLFLAHLRRTFVARRALLALGVAGVPVGFALLIALVSKHENPPPFSAVMHIGWFTLVQTIVPFLALIVGSAVVAEEIEDRTITYLFTRPIPRASILLGRWLAALALVLVLVGGSALLSLTILESIGRPADDLAVMPAGFAQRLTLTALSGAAVYSALFAVAGTFFRHPVLVGLGYALVFEVFFALVPGGIQQLSIQYYLKSFLLARDDELLEPFRHSLAVVELAEPAAALRTLGLVLVAALVLGAWRLTRREYVLSA